MTFANSIPELPDYGHKITILHLLNHTSGLRDYLALFELAGVNIDSVTTDEDALAVIARQKSLNFETRHAMALQQQRIFSAFHHRQTRERKISPRILPPENIFSPLEMKATAYRDDHTRIVPNRALAYDPKEKGDGFSLDISYFEQTGDGRRSHFRGRPV